MYIIKLMYAKIFKIINVIFQHFAFPIYAGAISVYFVFISLIELFEKNILAYAVWLLAIISYIIHLKIKKDNPDKFINYSAKKYVNNITSFCSALAMYILLAVLFFPNQIQYLQPFIQDIAILVSFYFSLVIFIPFFFAALLVYFLELLRIKINVSGFFILYSAIVVLTLLVLVWELLPIEYYFNILVDYEFFRYITLFIFGTPIPFFIKSLFVSNKFNFKIND